MFLSKAIIRTLYQSTILVSLTIALVGCNEKLTYSYLIEHSNVLKQKVADCQSIDEKSSEDISQCQIVMSAAADLIIIINEQQDDPEKFGQKILNAESDWVKAKEKLHDTQQILSTLETKKASSVELQAAQRNLDQAKEAYKFKHDQVKVLLSVVGMNSPE